MSAESVESVDTTLGGIVQIRSTWYLKPLEERKQIQFCRRCERMGHNAATCDKGRGRSHRTKKPVRPAPVS